MIDEASADTATSWLAPALLQIRLGRVGHVKIATEGNELSSVPGISI